MNFDNFLEETTMCFAKGQQLMEQGKMLEAKIEFNHALDLQVEKYGAEHETVAVCETQLGMCHFIANDFAAALDCFDKGLAINLKNCEYNSQEIANGYYLMGTCNMELKNYEEASLDFGHVVIISSNLFGPDSQEAAQARSFYNKAMMLYKPKDEGEVDKEIEAFTNDEEAYNKGSEYFDKGVSYLAVKCFLKAIKLHEDAKKPEDNKLVAYYRALAIAYTEMDMPDEAGKFLDKLLSMTLSIYGEDSPEAAGTYNFIGYNLLTRNDFPKAIDNLKKMLDINIKLHGEKDPEVIRNMAMISEVYKMMGDINGALQYQLKVEEKLVSINNSAVNHDLANCYGNLAAMYHTKCDFKTQLDYLQKQVRLEISMHGENTEQVLNIYSDMAHVYHHLGKEDEANALMDKVESIYKYLEEHPEAHHDGCTCGCHDHEHEHHEHDDDCTCGCHDEHHHH